LTSGKVYYDLLKFRKSNTLTEKVAIVRIEQFYPYKEEKIKEILNSYSETVKIIWVQEEPMNMGAWNFLVPKLTGDLSKGQKLYYAGRPESASPAVGSAKISTQQQKELIEKAFAI
jgi:2-oxoglutarate dehydrogenase complex dehydrogenase (E1) component-like enzyme